MVVKLIFIAQFIKKNKICICTLIFGEFLLHDQNTKPKKGISYKKCYDMLFLCNILPIISLKTFYSSIKFKVLHTVNHMLKFS